VSGKLNESAAFPNSVAGVLSGGNLIATFTLIDGVTHPPNAKALLVQIAYSQQVPNATLSYVGGTLAVKTTTGGAIVASYVNSTPVYQASGSTASVGFPLMARVPIAPAYPNTTQGTRTLVFTSPSLQFNTASLIVAGWEL
jgi:hypothetical protein